MNDRFPFDGPDAFMAWLKTQSVGIQREACLTIELLMDAGVDGRSAAIVVYNVVNVARKTLADAPISVPDNGKVH